MLWFWNVRRQEDGYIGRRMLGMELLWNWKRVVPKMMFMDAVRRKGMAVGEVTEEDVDL